MNGLLVFLLLLNAYILVVYLLYRKGKLGSRVELAGPFLMLRTQRGKPTIDKVAAAAPRFWERWGDLSIWTTWIAGGLVLLLLVYQLYFFVQEPQKVAEAAPPPQYLLGIPGLNKMIPLTYGTVGLIVALIIHEGSHGVLARVAQMRVKSLGLLMFIIPIGAFVEPDEKDLEKATTREKNRVFAAGPMSNITLALVSGILFSAVFMGSVAPANGGEGAGVTIVSPDAPAERAGFRPGDLLVTVNGVALTEPESYTESLNGTRAGDTITVEYLREGELRSERVTLTDKYEYFEAHGVEGNDESFRGDGYLGIAAVPMEFVGAVHGVLHRPFQDGPVESFNLARGGSFFIYSAYPFLVLARGVDVMVDPFRDFLVVTGPLAALPEPVFYVSAYMLYWLFWLNLMLGTFNALPMGPLDGGQMLKATLRERLLTWYGVDRSKLKVEQEVGVRGARLVGADEETQRKLDRTNSTVHRTVVGVGFFILGLILIPVVAPSIVRLLG